MIITSHGIQVFGRHLYQHNNINVTIFKLEIYSDLFSVTHQQLSHLNIKFTI